MANKTNLKDAIVDIAKNLEYVFKKYSRQTRSKAWNKITSKEGEKEIKKILNDPSRPINTFQKLATKNESFKSWLENMEKANIWLDDVRPIPPDFDIWVKTADEAIKHLESGKVSMISLDHDLGDSDTKTGYDVAKFIEKSAFDGTLEPIEVRVHSANPVGMNNMKMCINNAQRFWREKMKFK
jgi:hypothetical protein